MLKTLYEFELFYEDEERREKVIEDLWTNSEKENFKKKDESMFMDFFVR